MGVNVIPVPAVILLNGRSTPDLASANSTYRFIYTYTTDIGCFDQDTVFVDIKATMRLLLTQIRETGLLDKHNETH